jgi:hypothetical protein
MPLSSHTTAGASQLGTLLMSQPKGGKRSADLSRPAPWTLSGCRPAASTADSTSQRTAKPKVGLPSRCLLLALEKGAPCR